MDITAEMDPSQFTWYKRAQGGMEWVQEEVAVGVKELKLVQEEMDAEYQYKCVFTRADENYGKLSVDNTMMLSREPGTTDANDTFALNSGMLSVTTERTNAGYYLENGHVKVGTSGGETIAAIARFTSRDTTKTVSFKYDHNGLRTQKKVVDNSNNTTTTYDYTLHGKLITHLTKSVEKPNESKPRLIQQARSSDKTITASFHL